MLVVDDDAAIRKMLQWALEDEGFLVEVAADGPQALEALAHRRPSLMILDIGLPGLSGYEVADAVRAQVGADMPIVVITADGRAAMKARRVGAVAYFHKPFDIDDLMSAVRRSLGSDEDTVHQT